LGSHFLVSWRCIYRHEGWITTRRARASKNGANRLYFVAHLWLLPLLRDKIRVVGSDLLAYDSPRWEKFPYAYKFLYFPTYFLQVGFQFRASIWVFILGLLERLGLQEIFEKSLKIAIKSATIFILTLPVKSTHIRQKMVI